MKRDKYTFLEILGSSMALVSNFKNLVKILVLAFFTSSIFIPVVNILGIPIWLSIEKEMFNIYMSTKTKDEFVAEFWKLSLIDTIKKYFVLFLGFSLGHAIWFLILWVPLTLILSGVDILISTFLALLFPIILVVYFIFLFNAIGYLFNLECNEEKISQKECLLIGFKANFSISYLLKYSPLKLAKIFLILFALNFIFSNISILFVASSIAISLFFSVAYDPSILEILYMLFTTILSILVPFLIIPFFIHLNIFYIASKMKSLSEKLNTL